jgi:hypothetical protein
LSAFRRGNDTGIGASRKDRRGKMTRYAGIEVVYDIVNSRNSAGSEKLSKIRIQKLSFRVMKRSIRYFCDYVEAI